MNLLFCLTPIICPLGGYTGQAVADRSPPRQCWTPKSWHSACPTLIPWLLLPSWEKSLQILKGASGQALPWVNTLIC